MADTTRTPVFDRYEVLERIGSGGMGAVYKALDRHLDRLVALKVLPPGLQGHVEALERFKREARALARLKHPSVAAVYDANVERGFPYLVMEFIEGANLEQLLREQGPLPVEDAVRMGLELAGALQHIHEHGIVHRDVKTSNIMVESTGRAVLADFGIALVASLPRISRGALGTPEYMSPEQADGKTLDGRADVYSLGVVLYECLTGVVPFQRTGESLADLTALMKAVMEATVPPMHRHRRDIPGWLNAVVARCLAKSPEDRYAGGAELAAALRREEHQRWVPSASSHGRGNGRSSSEDRHVAGDAERVALISHTQPVVALDFSPDSRCLAAATSDRAVRVWDVATGRLCRTLLSDGGALLSVAYSPSGRFLAAGDVDGTVRMWNARSGRLRHVLREHTALAMSVAFSPDGAWLVSGGAEGIVRVWDVRRGELRQPLRGHAGYVLSVAFDPEGARLASGGADGTIRMWEPKTGRLLQTLRGHDAWVTSVAFSPDGARLITAGADGTIRVWEPETGRTLRTLCKRRAWIMSVACSPDGRQLVAACRDHTVCIWDLETGRLQHRLEGHTRAVMSVRYSPDGVYLASGSKDHTVRLWNGRSQQGRRSHLVRRMLRSLASVVGVVLFVLFVVAFPWQRAAHLDLATDLIPREALFGDEGILPDQAGWTMIVASPTERDRAEDIAERLRKQGYRIGIIQRAANGVVHYRVSVGQFKEQRHAVAARRQLAGSDLPSDTWIGPIGPQTAP